MIRSRNGFVLIAALWLLVALGAVGLDVSLRSRTRRLAAANLIDDAKARAAAFGGAEYARSRLTSAMLGRAEQLRDEARRDTRNTLSTQFQNLPAQTRANATQRLNQAMEARNRDVSALFRNADPAEDPWRDPELLIATDTTFSDMPFTLKMRDTGAALNINEADEGMLLQFFAQGLRLDYALAEKLAQAILDWRDQDDLPRVNGGEREQYIEAGSPVLPPNRQFSDVNELRYVLGMPAEVFETMKPYLMVVGAGRINLNSAPEVVLNALPGLSEAAVSTFLRQRNAGRMPRNLSELMAMVPPDVARSIQAQQARFNRRSAFATNEVEIVSEVVIPGSPVRAEARVIVSRSPTGAAVVWRKVD